MFFTVMSQCIAEQEEKLTDLQTAKDILLKLHEFETIVARGVMVVTNPTHQSLDIVIPQLEKLKEVFQKGESWTDIERMDPELKEIVEESVSMRKSMVKYLEGTEEIVRDSNIDVHRRNKYFSTKELASIVLKSHELGQRVVREEARIQNEEPGELRAFRSFIQNSAYLGLLSVASVQFILAFIFIADILGRTKKIADNLHLVSAGRRLPPQQKGKDEIAHLDQVVHETNEILAETRHKEVAILDNAADVICSLDERLRFTGVSATVNKIWNYSQEELLGSPLMMLLPKAEQASTTAEFVRIANGETQEGELENVIRCRDGAFKNFAWTVKWSPVQKTHFCVAHDVTERRALEKLKQQFLSMVSHDLRAPVAATSISISLLLSGKRGELSEGVRKILERTETSIVRLTELVNDLLELDKLEAGKLVLNRTTVSAYEVFLAAKESLDAMANSAYVKLVGPQGDAAVNGDELRLVQAVINLLSNAIKFSPKNGTVTLSIERNGGFVDFKIKDEGPGIAREDAALIFEKFRQSATAKQSTMKSTGLGLAIVKAIAEAHGGEVGVDSEVGKGSTFWIRLPAEEEDDSP
jgi:PAS domain S-box-containing protein